jgi:hypothetical protein
VQRSIDEPAVTGLTLAAIGAASAAGLKATQLARRAYLALAVSLVVVLQLANLVAVPLWAGQVVSGASISASPILGNLLLLVLIPLAIVFSLVDLILVLVLSVEIGRATPQQPGQAPGA